jgi:hypothetical protein
MWDTACDAPNTARGRLTRPEACKAKQIGSMARRRRTRTERRVGTSVIAHRLLYSARVRGEGQKVDKAIQL